MEKKEISEEIKPLVDLSSILDKKILIIGASGQVGRHLLSILEANSFPASNLILVASKEKSVTYNNKSINCRTIDIVYDPDFSPDIVFNCAPASVIKENLWTIWRGDTFIVDKSSAFRDDEEIPLVVPEINGEEIKDSSLISSPNCVAIPLSIALHAVLPSISNISHVAVSTYQSVSGAGNRGMKALLDEVNKCMLQIKSNSEFFERQIAFNLIPKIGPVYQDGSTGEESKVLNETKRILKRDLPMSVTCVRVPVLSSHSISLQIACTVDEFKKLEANLENNPAIRYISDPDRYCTPIDSTLENEVYISRLRKTSCGLSMWICCDNRNKGAALNALQIVLKKFTDYPGAVEGDTQQDEQPIAV